MSAHQVPTTVGLSQDVGLHSTRPVASFPLENAIIIYVMFYCTLLYCTVGLYFLTFVSRFIEMLETIMTTFKLTVRDVGYEHTHVCCDSQGTIKQSKAKAVLDEDAGRNLYMPLFFKRY